MKKIKVYIKIRDVFVKFKCTIIISTKRLLKIIFYAPTIFVQNQNKTYRFNLEDFFATRIISLFFQISSYDSNSHCMCVAGDVFCWWQDYNSDTASLLDTSSLQSTTIKNNYTSSLEMSVNIANGFEASRDSKSSVDQQEHVQEINTTLPTTMPPVAICLVMGTNSF